SVTSDRSASAHTKGDAAMGVVYDVAANALDLAVNHLFDSDPRVRAVGIGRHGEGYGFHVIRNAAQILTMSAAVGALPAEVQKVPLTYLNRQADPEPHVKLPFAGPGSPTVASLVPEQRRNRPLVCGLQIENFDDDTRTGVIAGGHIIVGTLGCFVT